MKTKTYTKEGCPSDSKTPGDIKSETEHPCCTEYCPPEEASVGQCTPTGVEEAVNPWDSNSETRPIYTMKFCNYEDGSGVWSGGWETYASNDASNACGNPSEIIRSTIVLSDPCCAPKVSPTAFTPTAEPILCCDCAEYSPSPGCAADTECESYTCADDPYCCIHGWDAICAHSAANTCENGPTACQHEIGMCIASSDGWSSMYTCGSPGYLVYTSWAGDACDVGDSSAYTGGHYDCCP